MKMQEVGSASYGYMAWSLALVADALSMVS
jgi:Co/Zn/Cd efflux system component